MPSSAHRSCAFFLTLYRGLRSYFGEDLNLETVPKFSVHMPLEYHSVCTHTRSHTQTHSLTPPHTHTHTPTLTYTVTHSHSHMLTHSRVITPTRREHTLIHVHTHMHAYTCFHKLTHPHTHALTHAYTGTHSLGLQKAGD